MARFGYTIGTLKDVDEKLAAKLCLSDGNPVVAAHPASPAGMAHGFYYHQRSDYKNSIVKSCGFVAERVRG